MHLGEVPFINKAIKVEKNQYMNLSFLPQFFPYIVVFGSYPEILGVLLAYARCFSWLYNEDSRGDQPGFNHYLIFSLQK